MDLVLIGGLILGAGAVTPATAQQRPDQGQQQEQAAQRGRAQERQRQDGARPGTPDRMLEDRVIASIAERAGFGPDIQVRANQGTVTVSGTVASQAAERRTLRAARRTPGVMEVRDELQVAQRAETAPDVEDSVLNRRVAQQIASEIEGAKAGEDWWFGGWRVEAPDNDWNFVVESENGRVVLEGEVPRYDLIRQAVEAARQVPGAQHVESQLEIDPDYYGYYGRPFRSRYAYPYAPYGPYAYPHGVYAPDVAPGERGMGMMGGHAVTGTVASIDRQAGRVTLSMQDGGQVTLPLPSRSLQDVRQGDRLTVRLSVMRDAQPAASPRTETGSDAQQQRQQQ